MTDPYTPEEMRAIARDSAARGAYDHERFTPWHDTIRRWAREAPETHLVDGHHEDEPDRFDTLGNFLTEGPGSYPGTTPLFVGWLNAHGQTTPDPAEQETPTVTRPNFDNYRDITAEEMTTWEPTIRRWVAEVGYDGAMVRHGEGRVGMHNSLLDLLAHPRAYPGSLPAFESWLVQHGITVPDPAVPSGDTVTLPTSPQQAFANVEDAVAACRRWETDTDPRLPDQRSVGSDYFNRSTYPGTVGFSDEVRTGYLADDFTAGSPYSQGFWRDVRTLGYGTPAWQPAPAPTTPEVTVTEPVLTPELLDQPVYQWPLAVREAAQHEIARFLYERSLGPSRTIGESLTNSNGALLPRDPRDHWTSHEFGPHTRFRGEVRDGTFVTTLTTIPEVTVPAFDFDTTGADLLADTGYRTRLAPYATAIEAYIRSDTGINVDWLRYLLLDEQRARATWDPMGSQVRVDHLNRFLAWARDHRDLFTTTPEVTTDTTPAPTGEPVIIPIGPEHPGWQEFAEKLAATATSHGMCPEYDRIARAVGLPTRKERVTYTISLEVAVDVERGYNADVRQLREAAKTLLEKSGAIDRVPTATKREQIVV